MPAIRVISVCIILLNLLLAEPAKAAYLPVDCSAIHSLEWQETQTADFTIQYTQSTADLAQIFDSPRWQNLLATEYARFSALFETSLAATPTIRIYPDVETYSCINPSFEKSAFEDEFFIHSVSGGGEIALIADNLARNYPFWDAQDTDLLRYDLGILFASQIAGNRLPPGLLAGIGRFAQDPAQTTALLRLNPVDWAQPRMDWRTLWSNAPEQGSLIRELENLSIVNFLVNRGGWAVLLQLLQDLSTASDYRQALEKNYGTSFDNLEQDWVAYYPRYFQTDWEYHPIYNPDLSRYAQMIKAENYGEAATGLKDVVTFLEKTNNPELSQQARLLYNRAKRGNEAEIQFAQAMTIYQSGEYDAFLDLLAQSEASYAEAGNRFYHLDEFTGYRRQLNDVIALHAELDDLQQQLPYEWNTFSLANRILLIGGNLIRLGDNDGYLRARLLLEAVEMRQRQQYIFAATMVVTIVLLLLGLLLYLSRRDPPTEALL